MKKNYFLAVLFAFGMISANAQFALDDMESYGGGNAPILDAQWGSWDGTAGTAMLSSGTYAQSGALSGWIDGSGIDPLLLLGDKIFGSWGLKFASYIPAGSTGYWNMQGQEAPGVQWVIGNVTFVDNVGQIDFSSADPLDYTEFAYPSDQWFETIINFDFNSGAGASTFQMWVDGVEVVAAGTPYADAAGTYAQALGGVNIYSAAATNSMYFDDVEYINDFYPGPLGVADLDAVGFSAYPNPVKNVLNLQANEEISTAVVYNVLGQEVYNANINALTAIIDMTSFASGAYFVKVNVGGTEGVVKVLK